MDCSHISIKDRKMTPTGGNRSWTEEEEHYLLQTRMQKMPYKHIAAHLKKTELACRLHYHQLSHGSHRRKRASSASPSTSVSARSSPSISHYHPTYEREEYRMDFSRQSSPVNYGSNTPPNRAVASHNTSPSRNHKILLPKPQHMTPQTTPEPFAGLRINTRDSVIHRAPVDTDRLRAIYESRRGSFWASIAAEYGSDISPAQLEHIWQQGANVVRPPTPEESPERHTMSCSSLKPSPFPNRAPPVMEPGKSFNPINQPSSSVAGPGDRLPCLLPDPTHTRPTITRSATWANSCSISPNSNNMPIAALLTEDRNPRGEEA